MRVSLREFLAVVKTCIWISQDYHYFPYKNDSMVAVFIHLDDTDSDNGGLAIYPGTIHLIIFM